MAFCIPLNLVPDLAIKTTYTLALEWMVVGVLLSLSLLHFFIYAFNVKGKSNLYFSLFAFLLAANRVIYVYQAYHQPSPNQFYLLGVLTQALNLLAIMAAIYFIWIITAFKDYRPLNILLAIGLPLLAAVFLFRPDPLLFKSINVYRVTCYIFIIYALLKAMRRRQSGIWIVSSGTLLLMITMLVLRFDVFSIWSGNPPVRVWLVNLGYLVSLALYSVYLAREQAKTTLSLDEQLEQVKALSAENRQKDKYNQELLERQNTALEVLVKLRTEELTEKNAELEVQKIRFITRRKNCRN